MEAERILNFIIDLLNKSKSPQADAFNTLFNNMEIIYAFKINFPSFLLNSPYKSQAQKLLCQYMVKKQIQLEHIPLFFSEDATENVTEKYKATYDKFLRYYKRQINQMNFGVRSSMRTPKVKLSGLEIIQMNSEEEEFQNNLRDSFIFSGVNRKHSRSQINLDYTNSCISANSSEDDYVFIPVPKHHSPVFKVQ